nr:zinc finger protein [Hymenolepis microstoma]
MPDKSSSTQLDPWGIPRDKITNLSIRETAEIFGFTLVNDGVPSAPKVPSRNDVTSGEASTNLNYNCSVELKRAISQIMTMTDGPTSFHNDLNASKVQSERGSESFLFSNPWENSTYNLASSVDKGKCIEDSGRNKMYSESNEDLSGVKRTNSEVLGSSFKQEILSLSNLTLGSMVSAFTNRETLNQRTIANPETISPVSNSSKPSHIRTRTQRRAKRQTQYSCSVCPESFRRVKDLDEHTKAVHGKYECQVCGVKIANRSNLLRHGLKHSNQRPYECPICSRTYTRQDHLKRHMDVNHQGYGANRNMAVVNVAEVHTSTLTPQIPTKISV